MRTLETKRHGFNTTVEIIGRHLVITVRDTNYDAIGIKLVNLDLAIRESSRELFVHDNDEDVTMPWDRSPV